MAMSQTGDARMSKFSAIRCASGEEITKFGDPGRGVFVVESGTFSIQMGLSRTTLQPGSSVGEISMLFGCARADSLTCDEDGCLWHLSRQDWLDLLLHHKIDVASTSWIPMLLAEQSWSKDLTGAQREDLARASTLVAFSAGEAIFESGCGAESIGIVLQSQAFRTSRETQRWFPGECFGLDALTPGGRHRYSVTAEANLLILMLPRHILHDLPVATLDTLRHTLNCEFLHEISWFGGLTEMERRAAMQLAESKTYLPGSCMCGTSQRADELCVITFGTALRRSKPPQPHAENPRSFVCATALARCLFSHRNESGLSLDRKNRRRPSRMSFIGQPLVPRPRKPLRDSGVWDRKSSSDTRTSLDEATPDESLGPGSCVIADADAIDGFLSSDVTAESTTEVVSLSVADLELALGPLPAVILRARHRIRMHNSQFAWPNPLDLVFGPWIGAGTFGHVQLIQNKSQQRYYALKVIDKTTSNSRVAINERNILNAVAHNCIATLHGSWEDAKYFYIMLDFVAGGELYTRVSQLGHLDFNVTSFYVACVTSALVHMHSRSIAYRDLKSENVMLDASGYAIIVDFGLSKVLLGKTYTMCGTPEYLAPEMIDKSGHGTEVDWWALGVLTYEMLVGSTPFACEDELELLNRIVHAEFSFPWWLHGSARDFIGSMLVPDPTKRLGDERLDVGALIDQRGAVIHHKFLNVDFVALEQRQLAAPFVPTLTGSGDTRYFDFLDDFPGSTHIAKEWQEWRC